MLSNKNRMSFTGCSGGVNSDGENKLSETARAMNRILEVCIGKCVKFKTLVRIPVLQKHDTHTNSEQRQLNTHILIRQ